MEMGELRSAVRALKSTPVPVGAAVLTLALAIGINAGMVGLVDRALLSPPDQVADPDRVVTLAFERGEGDERVRMTTTSYVTFASIRDHVPGFAAAAAWQRSATTAIVEGEQIQVNSMIVSGAYFDLLGATARLGRPVQRDDDRTGAAPVVVLSHAFWKSAFGGDSSVLGRRVSVGGLEYTVSGVMPPRFSGHSPASVDIWMPFAAAMRQSPGWDQQAFRRIAAVVARLAPETTMPAAATQAGAATNTRVVLTPLGGADVSSADRRVAYWLTGVSALVLVIGLANAATLLLVRASRRRREFAIRSALGASRARLLLQVAIEAVLVSVAATGASLLLASWFDGAVRQVLLPDVAPGDGTGRTMLIAAAAAGVLAALVAGIANASNLPRQLPGGSLEAPTPHFVRRRGLAGALRATAGKAAGRRPGIQTGLLVLQTSLSVLLLAGAGMFGRSLHNLLSQDFGITMDNVVVVDLEQGPGGATRGDLFDAALDRVRAVPGIRSATRIAAIPFSGFNVPPISVPGLTAPPGAGKQLPFLQAATPEFFDILGVRIVEGRKLTAADEHGAPVVVVNETMARTVWPGESALGKCIRIGFDPNFDPETAVGPPTPSAAVACREVVGVAHDMRQRSLVPTGSEDHLMQYFVPFSQVPVPPFIPNPDRGAWGLLLKVEGDIAAVAPAVRRVIVDGRADVPFIRVRPYAQLLDRQMRPWRLGTALLGLFSALALIVGAVGIYAAFAHAVTMRRREMAIRIAIGARPRGVVRMILGEALRLAAAGIVAGWIAAIAGGRWLQSLLFDTSRADPLVLGAAAAVMLAVAVIATLLPARAASRANPAALLRS
jgi:putative ABC transport system permease protein